MLSDGGRIDRFVIIKTIAAGKSASLMLARDETTNQLVVLKIYLMGHLYMSNELSGYRRLEQTSRTLGLFAFSTQSTLSTPQGHSQESYTAVEYAPYGDLYSLLKKHRRFPATLARRLIREIIEAIQVVHMQGFSHNALSLEHVYIDESLHTRLGSLAAVQHTTSGSNDLFQCGVMLFQMILGRPPFWNQSPRDPFLRHLHNRNFEAFWKAFDVDNEHRDVLQLLLINQPSHLVSVQEALSHNWMNGPVFSDSEFLKFLM